MQKFSVVLSLILVVTTQVISGKDFRMGDLIPDDKSIIPQAPSSYNSYSQGGQSQNSRYSQGGQSQYSGGYNQGGQSGYSGKAQAPSAYRPSGGKSQSGQSGYYPSQSYSQGGQNGYGKNYNSMSFQRMPDRQIGYGDQELDSYLARQYAAYEEALSRYMY